MAVAADFIVSNRVADSFNTVVFTDMSTGAITARKWILGDGTVVDGNDTTVKHTYSVPGKYAVTLIVQDAVDQNSITKTDYITVNFIKPAPSFIIMQSFDDLSGEYWRLYIDVWFHIVYETPLYIYRSKNVEIEIREWSFIQFDPISEKMFLGSYINSFKEIITHKMANTSPIVPGDTKTEIAVNSTLKIDELMIWSVSKDLVGYYNGTRGKAGYLDLQN
jgi:PKD repeat protein